MKSLHDREAVLVELVSQAQGRARVRIAGSSMEPTLRSGMVVDVEPLSGAPRIGDVLVFRSTSGLIAHRLVGEDRLELGALGTLYARGSGRDQDIVFVTSGDNQPDKIERVRARFVVGRIAAVWSGPNPEDARIDDAAFRIRGILTARTRIARSAFARIRKYAKAAAAVLRTEPNGSECRAFSALVAASFAFEARAFRDGIDILEKLPVAAVVEISRRHRAHGLLSRWLEDSASAGIAVSPELSGAIRRTRYVNALQAKRIFATASDVRDRFVSKGIEHAFLKGAARIVMETEDCDRHFSGDVDVCVPRDRLEESATILRDAGYVDVHGPKWISSHAGWLHHYPPLVKPADGISVEIHSELVPIGLVSQRIDFARLAPSIRYVESSLGEFCVLGAVATAINLLYHGRAMDVWRDIVLLSRALREFDRAQRTEFDSVIEGECRDRLRLRSIVSLADELSGDRSSRSAAMRRYLRWAMFREDWLGSLDCHDLAESIIGKCRIAALHLGGQRTRAARARRLIKNLLTVPAILRARSRAARAASIRSQTPS